MGCRKQLIFIGTNSKFEMSKTNNKPTIHEIASALGLDSSTVSRALNNSERVKLKTKQKVFQKAKELGYMPNMMASNLRRQKSNTIGVVVPRISRYFFSSTIAGIEEVAYRAGYNVMICQSLEQLEREQKIVKNLIANRVDGILMSVSMQTTNTDHLSECIQSGTPLVFFDRHVDGLKDVGQVLLDDFKGGFEATEHLITKGCSRIAHFTAPTHVSIYKNRLAGYKEALRKYELPYDDELVFESDLMESDGTRLAKKIVSEFKDVDGIFSANDFAAIGAMKYFKSEGIKIPSRIAIVGFSNEPSSEVIEPALTTLDQSGGEMGRLACNLILEYLTSGTKSVAQKTIILDPQLVERRSTTRSSEGVTDQETQ